MQRSLVSLLLVALLACAGSVEHLRHKHMKVLNDTVVIDQSSDSKPWDWPVFPNELPDKTKAPGYDPSSADWTAYDKKIPRHLWIALRNKSDELNYQMKPLFERNPKWKVHLEGNSEKDSFMQQHFAGTSLLWAYHQIHPLCGAAKADIWRYAVLYTWGGVYIDDDSDIARPLDEVLADGPTDDGGDTMVVTHERNTFNGDACYIPQHHLSDGYTFRQPYAKGSDGANKEPFYGRIVPNWLIMSAPRHPVLKATLENIVEIVRSEYFRSPMVRHLHTVFRWNLVMCSTGPSLLTASAREVLLKDPSVQVRVTAVDFRDYGGRFKAVSTRASDQADHYMRTLDKNRKMGTLRDYFGDETALSAEQLAALEGKAIQGHNGKSLYFVEKGTRRPIGNMDTFQALHFTPALIWVVTDFQLASIPEGPTMPPMPWDPNGPDFR